MTLQTIIAHCVLIAASALTLCAQSQPLRLETQISVPFRFVAYGDTRFTNPKNIDASKPLVRQTLVQAIADVHPAFVSIGGDIAYEGADMNDWLVWDKETAVWRENKIAVYPALGNHDLYGDEKIALANYFQRFPELQNNRYYSVRAANALLLMLDSSQEETSGAQGQWLAHELDTLPGDVDFVCLVLHHPPYTDSSEQFFGGGHSARHSETALAQMLEERQAHTRARFVVFAGHVHNYERHEHNGVTYFVTGGGGAHPYLIARKAGDPLFDKPVNYHYLLVEVDRGKMKVTMNRVELANGKAIWTTPDSAEITAPATKPAAAGK
ncbi:MAG TPA: metallophosphoesterase [Terriglobales bacterium]|nr:metallophosphoesterase [Terriglobales bacterium]